jgi:hypothetical protein
MIAKYLKEIEMDLEKLLDVFPLIHETTYQEQFRERLMLMHSNHKMQYSRLDPISTFLVIF